MMNAAIGTLPFLATLWLLVVLGASVLEESGVKIAAALKGTPTRQPFAGSRSLRIRVRCDSKSKRVEPRLRAVA
ncbi:MAG TPA: hypothetical protein VJM15_11475 [Sphingomicrobium sp.]|nr:hypothetical protein [Sphingomicrobium sp.]